MLRALAGGAVVLLTSSLALGARTPKGPCSPVSQNDQIVQDMRDLVSEDGHDAPTHLWRVADSLPSLPARDVHLIRDKAVCQRALDAVNRSNQDSAVVNGGVWIAKSVIVFQVGDVYIVNDPAERAGEYRPMYVYDSGFTRLKVIFTY